MIKNDRAQVSWDLSYNGTEEPLFDFPHGYYYKGFPKGEGPGGPPPGGIQGENSSSMERKSGLRTGSAARTTTGEQHTDHYAWGQVAGFENS